MNVVIIDREILLSEDFTEDFAKTLCNYLNDLIDKELEKDEADFDLIDEYAEAINNIHENGIDILPVISDKAFMKKLGIEKKSGTVKIAAIAAVVALIIGIGAVATQGSPSEIARDVAKYFRERFSVYDLEPVTDQTPETTTVPPAPEESTTESPKIKCIEARLSDDFRREYYVGEIFDKTGLEVIVLTNNGFYKTDDYKVSFDSPFAEKAGEQTVTVTAYGFSDSFKVRILNSEKTSVLNSIYATFPEGFDFTYRDDPEAVLSGMRVYAVYSSGEEKELEKDEYTINVEETKLLFSKNATVRIEYRGCTSEFVMKGVLK